MHIHLLENTENDGYIYLLGKEKTRQVSENTQIFH